MTSSFAWVDFSEDDRDCMNMVMRLFAEKDTLDELGIGAVRDAIAYSDEGGRLYRLKPARDSDDPGRLAGRALVSTSSSGQLAGSSSSF